MILFLLTKWKQAVKNEKHTSAEIRRAFVRSKFENMDVLMMLQMVKQVSVSDQFRRDGGTSAWQVLRATFYCISVRPVCSGLSATSQNICSWHFAPHTVNHLSLNCKNTIYVLLSVVWKVWKYLWHEWTGWSNR